MHDLEQTTLRDYLRIIFKYKAMIVIIVAVAMASVTIGLKMRTPKYESTVKMLVKAEKETSAEYYKGIHVGGAIVSSHITLVNSRAVLNPVVKSLKLYQRPLDYEKEFSSGFKKFVLNNMYQEQQLEFQSQPPEVQESFLFNNAIRSTAENIFVDYSEDSPVFIIRVTDFTPKGAMLIANSISRSYVIFDLEQQIVELELRYGDKHSTVRQLRNYINEFKQYLDGRDLPPLDAIGPASVKIIEQAEPGLPVKMKPNKNIALILGFIMSLTLGFILAFGFDFLDQTIKSPKDIESFLKMNFLGSIPRTGKKKKLLNMSSSTVPTAYTDSYQKISHKLFSMIKERDIKTVLIADLEGVADTAYVVANLAMIMSREAGNRVLVVDTAMRSPSIHGILNIANTPGLSDVLKGEVPIEMAITDLESKLHIMPAGNSVTNPVNILDSTVMSEFLKKVRDQYDIVLLYSSDLINYADTVVLSSFAESLLFVFNEGKVKRQIFNHALVPLKEKDVKIIGAILNNRRYYIPGVIYRMA